MAKLMRTPEQGAEAHLAGIIRAYLSGQITDKMFEGHIYKSHSLETFRNILQNPRFAYLLTINPTKLDEVKTKFSV